MKQLCKNNLGGGQKSCQNKYRLSIVDIMQGIAMLWVIIGHHLLDFMPLIYKSVHYYIYSFHMPLFIFISSFLIVYSYKEISYKDYVYRKFRKFFIPYALVGGLVIGLTAMRYGIDIVFKNILYLLVSPKQSEATFLWYIYLLFFLYALYPFCVRGVQKFKIYFEFLLLLIGVYFYLYPIQISILCIDYFTKYFLFYVLGLVAAWHFSFLKMYLNVLKIIGLISFFLFVILTTYVFVQSRNSIYLMLCFSAIPAMYGLANILKFIPSIKKVLINISKNCFHIYLLHMFFIQGIAWVFMKVYACKIESVEIMFFYIVISTTISIIGPIVLFKLYDKLKLKFIR